MNTKEIKKKIMALPIVTALKKQGYKVIDEDEDDGELRIVFKHPKDKEISIDIMFQEGNDDL